MSSPGPAAPLPCDDCRTAIVVGAGVMGVCSAWALVKRGVRVTLLDASPLPNPNGSSICSGRIIRHAYGDHDNYTRMAQQAFESWPELWKDLGRSFYTETGVLVLESFDELKKGESWAARTAACMARNQDVLPELAEWLGSEELEARFPYLARGVYRRGFRTRTGGVLESGAIVEALIGWLQRHPLCVVRGSCAVSGVDVEGKAVVVNGERMHSDYIVVTAGVWTAGILPQLAGRFTPSRQVSAFAEVPARSSHDVAKAWKDAPVMLDLGGDIGFFVVPPGSWGPMKFGGHSYSLSGNPFTDDWKTQESDVQHPKFVNAQDYRILQRRACYYDCVAKDAIIFEALRPDASIVTLCGTSGHGFKFGALFGKAIAEVLLGLRDMQLTSEWIAGRAREGKGVDKLRENVARVLSLPMSDGQNLRARL